MKGKDILTASESGRAKTLEVTQTATKKPYQEPILTKHEQLLENTHFGGSGDVSGIILDP